MTTDITKDQFRTVLTTEYGYTESGDVYTKTIGNATISYIFGTGSFTYKVDLSYATHTSIEYDFTYNNLSYRNDIHQVHAENMVDNRISYLQLDLQQYVATQALFDI